MIALQQVLIGNEKKFIGTRGKCRFCGESKHEHFGKRTNAHTFPEFLGNKWLFSLDECKKCNAKFSLYENALAKAIGPLLTLGGVNGKRGVRQIGRSGKGNTVKHTVEKGRRRISIRSTNAMEQKFDFNRNIFDLNIPMPEGKFVPILAFKAICKIAISIMPTNELDNFCKLIEWLNDTDDYSKLGSFVTHISFGNIGNAPLALSGQLLRRTDTLDPVPYMVFVIAAGSVCLQIIVPSDGLDSHVPLNYNFINRPFKSIFGPLSMDQIEIKYRYPVKLDWSARIPVQLPIKSFSFKFNLQNSAGEFVPILRNKLCE